MGADHEGEGEHAARFDIDRVVETGTEELAEVVHPSVVDSPEPLGDRGVPPGPVTDSEVDGQEPIIGKRECTGATDFRRHVSTFPFDSLDDLVGALPLPSVEHRGEEFVAVGELPVETAFRDAEPFGEELDLDRVRPAVAERSEALLDPTAAGGAEFGGHAILLPSDVDKATSHDTLIHTTPYR